jgi:hypothetical protein
VLGVLIVFYTGSNARFAMSALDCFLKSLAGLLELIGASVLVTYKGEALKTCMRRILPPCVMIRNHKEN